MRKRLTTDEGHPGLLVSERCENLIQEFLGYKEEQVGTSAATDHALDATRYALMGEASGGGGAASSMVRLGGDDAGGTEGSSGGVNLNKIAQQQSRNRQKYGKRGGYRR